jgi:hypothetical protein
MMVGLVLDVGGCVSIQIARGLVAASGVVAISLVAAGQVRVPRRARSLEGEDAYDQPF